MQDSPGNYFVNDGIWFDHFNQHDTSGWIIVEYVWIGGTGWDLRSKSRSLRKLPERVEDFPVWNFDGSSTGQAPGNDSEVLLKPVALFRDPFRGDPHKLVFSECIKVDGTPALHNNRAAAAALFARITEEHQPWFGMEQEYSLLTANERPLGWPTGGYPKPQGPYYCGNGVDAVFGRSITEAHYKACLFAGIQVSGVNAEVMPSQWEYQVGPCLGIAMADQLWMSRFIMFRLGEYFRLKPSFYPKLFESGDWNGAGCHCNFSTKAHRAEGGLKEIIASIERTRPHHKEMIAQYGKDNHKRLTGKHETASIEVFTYGVADRGASIRIPRDTERDGCGYYEDRRPASNCDPYIVTALVAQAAIEGKVDYAKTFAEKLKKPLAGVTLNGAQLKV